MHEFMEKLVEKTTQRLSVQESVASNLLKNKDLTPDIVISRDPGSGGKVIAEMVSKKLKWKLLDREILVELARQLGIPDREFADVDEHTRGWFADSIHSLINPFYVNDLHYISHLKRLILHAAKNEDAVILGRGANHIIPPSQCLRVRVTASFSNRVKNTVKHEGKTREEAEEWVRKVESKRVHFVQQYFHVNPYNPWHYDIIVNTDFLTLEQARDLIIDAYFAKFPDMFRKMKKRLGK